MICPWLSSLYMAVAMPICLWLLRQLMALAFSLALLKAGKSIAARMAMMAITTNSSIRVKPAGPVARRMGAAFLYSVLIIATHILLLTPALMGDPFTAVTETPAFETERIRDYGRPGGSRVAGFLQGKDAQGRFVLR